MLAKLLFALCSSTLGLSANIPSSRWDNEAYDTPDKSCPCGYVLTHYDNAYYPVYRRVTFDSLPKGKLQGPDALQSVGFDISDDIYVGGTGPENTTTVGHYANIAVADGDDGSSILRLLVPGGQHIGGNLSGAEIHSSQAFTGGVFTAEMQISPVVGTAQAVVSSRTADDAEIASSPIIPPQTLLVLEPVRKMSRTLSSWLRTSTRRARMGLHLGLN